MSQDSSLKNIADIYVSGLRSRIEQLETLFNGFISSQKSVAVYVDVNGDDSETNTGKSSSSPFKTLQRAVTELQKYRAGGETNFVINVNPGTYVFVNSSERKDRITLFHIDSTESFPLLIRKTPNTSGTVTFRWDVTDIQFSAFILFRPLSPTRFENIDFVCNDTTGSNLPYPCFISTANGLGLLNCNFSNVTGIAVQISGGRISMIRNCTFTGMYTGDYDDNNQPKPSRYLSPYGVILSGCKEGIRNVSISNFYNAIELRDASSLTNDVYKSTATTLEPNAIVISDCKYCLRALYSSGLQNFHPTKMTSYNDANVTNRDAISITLNGHDLITEYTTLPQSELDYLYYLDNTSWDRN